MDSNGNAAQGGVSAGPSSGVGVGADSGANFDWRLQLQPDDRQRIVNKITETLKRVLGVPVPEGLNELQKIAVRFEEKIHSTATSQSDYLRKISLKMLSMETKAQPGLNARLPNHDRISQAALLKFNSTDRSPKKLARGGLPKDLREIHQKLSIKLSKLDGMVPPNTRGGEQIEKMKHFKVVLEQMMEVLALGKHNVLIGLKDKLTRFENQILSILQNYRLVRQKQPQVGVRFNQPHLPPPQQSLPGMQSQPPPEQQQPQQIRNQQNQLPQQSNIGAMPRSNSSNIPIALQQGIQNTLQSDNTIERTRKCKICGACAHKRRSY